jgi:hypothetical protein
MAIQRHGGDGKPKRSTLIHEPVNLLVANDTGQ